jgi:4-hydroxy-tetrahydrodipicolinate synthase
MNNTPISFTRPLPRRNFVQLLGLGAAGLALARTSTASAAESGAAAAKAKPAGGKKQFRGLFPIGQSPFTADNKLDLEGLAAQVTFCNRGGVHGFVWPQIASGWTNLTPEERLAGAEAILAAGKNGSTTLVIGVQSKDGNMQEVERYAKHAAEHGADAIVSLPPPNMTDEKQLLEYYQQVGRMTSLPLFVQTQGEMSIDLAVQIYQTVPTARYLKDESAADGGPLQRVTEIRKRTNDEMKVFAGQGVRTMINEMELGFSGHCPVVALADVYASAFDLWHAGKKQEAFDMFGRILAFNSMGSADSNALLVARGVFKPGVHSRPTPGMGDGGGAGAGRGGAGRGGAGGGGRGGPRLDEQGIRHALDTYLKPYLRA